MQDYELHTDTIEVPKNTGVDGFVHTIRQLLKLPRVQSISIDAKGKVSYERYVREGEKHPLNVDFEGVEPWHIIRNAHLEEMTVHANNAATTLVGLMDRALTEKLYPIAFVTGANSILWSWYASTTGYGLQVTTHLCGLPIYQDRNFPDTALALCTAYARDGSLIDTQKSYKIEMDMAFSTQAVGPETTVEIVT